MKSVFIIYQYSIGVGHFTRMAALAHALADRNGHRVTLFSGGRPIPGVVPPASIEFVQLPATELIDISRGINRAVDHTLSLEEVEARRGAILLKHFQHKQPDAIITEYYPFVPERFGRTLHPLFDAIRNGPHRPWLISSIRTFPTDPPSQVTAEQLNEVLRKDFNLVLHHADPRVFPLHELGGYMNAALKGMVVIQTGFLRRELAPHTEPTREAGLLLTVGGGRDGHPYLERWIAAARHASNRMLFPLNVVCGPQMAAVDKGRIHGLASSDVIVHEYLTDLCPLIRASRGVVCMGGYNTLNEALSLGKPVLAFPRDAVSEQALQVDGLVARGLIMSGGRSMDIGTIARNMLRLLDFKPAFIPDFAGAARSAACIQDLLESAESAERHHLQEDHVPSG